MSVNPAATNTRVAELSEIIIDGCYDEVDLESSAMTIERTRASQRSVTCPRARWVKASSVIPSGIRFGEAVEAKVGGGEGGSSTNRGGFGLVFFGFRLFLS